MFLFNYCLVNTNLKYGISKIGTNLNEADDFDLSLVVVFVCCLLPHNYHLRIAFT